jgi:hypothetical protein
VEEIKDTKGKLLAIIDNIEGVPPGLNFYGSPQDSIQVVSFRHPKGKILRNHRHIIHSTPDKMRAQEVFIVFKGSAKVRIFDDNDSFIRECLLIKGAYCIIYSGGSGYTILEDDTKILEVKSGPFLGSELDRVLI